MAARELAYQPVVECKANRERHRATLADIILPVPKAMVVSCSTYFAG